MKITFQDPLNGKPFDIVNNNPFLNATPKKGVYVYGLLLDINNCNTFVPLNVGITNGIINRRLIKQHYTQLSTGCSTKEIFDFTKCNTLHDVRNIYQSIKHYDSFASKRN